MMALPDREDITDFTPQPIYERIDWPLEVRVGDTVIARTTRGIRALEYKHLPAYYIPAEDVDRSQLVSLEGTTHCPWKGDADYFALAPTSDQSRRLAWSYPAPKDGASMIKDHFAFYCTPEVTCIVGGEPVFANDSQFRSGWRTGWIKTGT